jgi:hypothetical protein
MLVPAAVFGQTPRATVVTVEGATTTYRVQDMGGRLVEVEVPSRSLADIQTSSQGLASRRGQPERSAGTIPATVVAVDTLTNTVKVRTQAGQTIELAMPAKGLQIGEQLTLVVPRRP